AGQGADEEGLGDPGDALDESVLAGEDDDQRSVDRLGLADDHAPDLGARAGERFLEPIDVSVHGLLFPARRDGASRGRPRWGRDSPSGSDPDRPPGPRATFRTIVATPRRRPAADRPAGCRAAGAG